MTNCNSCNHGQRKSNVEGGPLSCFLLQEGWQPGTFSSSRSVPAQRKQQSVEDFMDEDELEERQKTSLGLKVRCA
jgi:hypothetical protein